MLTRKTACVLSDKQFSKMSDDLLLHELKKKMSMIVRYDHQFSVD